MALLAAGRNPLAQAVPNPSYSFKQEVYGDERRRRRSRKLDFLDCEYDDGQSVVTIVGDF